MGAKHIHVISAAIRQFLIAFGHSPPPNGTGEESTMPPPVLEKSCQGLEVVQNSVRLTEPAPHLPRNSATATAKAKIFCFWMRVV